MEWRERTAMTRYNRKNETMRVERLREARWFTERGNTLADQARRQPERADHLLHMASLRFERANALYELAALPEQAMTDNTAGTGRTTS